MLDEENLDLLTAALIGVIIGAGATLMLRRGPGGSRPLMPMLRAAGRGALWTGEAAADGARWLRPRVTRSARLAAKRAGQGADWARDRGEEVWESGPVEAIRDYAESARETIADTVESELRDLKKAIRRQRRRLGV